MIKPIIKAMRRVLLPLLLLAAFLLAYMLYMDMPKSYLNRRIDFPFHADIRYLYRYDAVGEGKDYNSIHVCQLGRDAAAFEAYLRASPDWYTLPIPDGMQDMILYDMESDPYVAEMMAVEDGFWCIERFGSDSFSGVYVYNCATHLLYIRTSSYVIRELPQALWLENE